jgi:predicted TPR repeat methyltransferase
LDTIDAYHCPCCGRAEWRRVLRLPKLIFGTERAVLRCKHCGCGATWPTPTLHGDYYEENEDYAELFRQKEALYKLFAKQLIEQLPEELREKGVSLLDVGCGGGFLVQVASELGMCAEGIELNAQMVAWAKDRGLAVAQGKLEDLLAKKKRYNVVVASAILEHLADPCDLLGSCRELLEPGGVLLVSQANLDGLLPSVFPWGWYGWQPQEHYWHFTPRSIELLLRKVGFEIVGLRRGSLHHEWYTSGGVKNVVGRNMATAIARAGELVAMGDSFDVVARVAHRSTELRGGAERSGSYCSRSFG